MKELVKKLPCQSGTRDVDVLTAPVFVADLHLSWTDRKTARSFFDFLSHEALNYRELFILGDIFAFWLGDDARWLAGPVIRAFKAYTATGRKLYLMQGNRDVMLGETFAEDCQATLIQSATVVSVHGKNILLSHGDEWCTLDKDYQAFRTMMRSEAFQREAFSMSVPSRILWAMRARKKSSVQKQIKTAEMMDVVDSVVRAEALARGCAYVIHGHTHQPAVHDLGGVQRFVLSDWSLSREPLRRGWIDVSETGEPRLNGYVVSSD